MRHGWGHQQGAVHMAAARLGCQKQALVDTRWASGCVDGLRKHCLQGSILAGWSVEVLNLYLLAKDADYCMSVNEWMCG